MKHQRLRDHAAAALTIVTFISELVQYGTDIYPRVADHSCETWSLPDGSELRGLLAVHPESEG